MAYVPPPQIANVLRAGKQHPQYAEAVRIYNQQRYAYDQEQRARVAAQQARTQLGQQRQADVSQAKIDAASGALERKPAHYLSQAERQALDAVRAKQQEQQNNATNEAAKKNPYLLAPERQKEFSDETARMRRFAEAQSDPVTRQQYLREADARDAATQRAQSFYNAVEQKNDPGYKIVEEQRKEQAKVEEANQRAKDDATKGVIGAYEKNPGEYEFQYGKDAANAAKALAEANQRRQLDVATGGVLSAQAAQDAALARANAKAAAQGFRDPGEKAASELEGFNFKGIGQRLADPKMTQDQRNAMLAAMTPDQRDVVRQSMQIDAALTKGDAVRQNSPGAWGMAKEAAGKTWDFFTGGKTSPRASSVSSDSDQSPTTTPGERAGQAVQSVVNPQRGNEPSPDWQPIVESVRSRLNTGGMQDPTTSGDTMPSGMTDDNEAAPGVASGSLADKALGVGADIYRGVRKALNREGY